MSELWPRVWSVGTFDGVHRGHQALLHRAAVLAHGWGEAFGVVTFDPPPAAVLRGPDTVWELTPLAEKVRRLGALDVPRVEVLAFTPAFAARSAEEFAEEVLGRQLKARALVEGYNFTYGRGGLGTVETLTQWGRRRGVEVVTVGPVLHQGAAISSSRIRQAIRAGDLALAAALLGRPYSASGAVVHGDGRGRALGFPTANLALEPRKAMPPFGVYAGRAQVAGTSRPAVANWGLRPMYAVDRPLLEVHLLEGGADLYGTPLEFEFHFYLRPERRFSGVEELRRAVTDDIAAARRLLAGAAS